MKASRENKVKQIHFWVTQKRYNNLKKIANKEHKTITSLLENYIKQLESEHQLDSF